MSATAAVAIHESQFPENVRRALRASLRTRKINPKFHYDSVKQTQKWLALHQAHSPSRRDPDVRGIYEQSFAATAAKIKSAGVHVVGLGCGGGQKDSRLLAGLQSSGKKIFYTPCDVSVAMVLTARETARTVLPAENCFPLVCDLAATEDWSAVFAPLLVSGASRLFTFFGMIPNFEPRGILPKLASLVRRNDWLLFSANLAPGPDYPAGVRKILPQYDNDLTRDWLMTLLLDLGMERRDGRLKFSVEAGDFGLLRVVANFHFVRVRRIEAEGETFMFQPGEKIRLFFSYRYTPERVQTVLARWGLAVCEQWIAGSAEEGVFLCRKP
ncbi:MAG TPA: L-histidine N(alpha)-methyltransferase [Verrucomicrobiae bacterium]|nr:L-histidine N(alpha)-methyltransferase [Verrucomicrobiae bacterium]